MTEVTGPTRARITGSYPMYGEGVRPPIGASTSRAENDVAYVDSEREAQLAELSAWRAGREARALQPPRDETVLRTLARVVSSFWR